MSSDVSGGIGENRTTSGTVKGGAKGIVYSLVYADTGAGIVLLRDGGAAGAIKGAARLGGAGSVPLSFPRGCVCSTDIYLDMTGAVSPNVNVSYE